MLEDTTNFSNYELSVIKRKLSTWNKTSSLIYNTKELDIIRDLMFAEIHSRNRPYHVKRIYQRFNRLRCNNELANIFMLVEGIKTEPELVEAVSNQQRLTIFCKQNKTTLLTYKKLLRAEVMNKNRKYMIRLLHGKFQTLRRLHEIKKHKLKMEVSDGE